MGKAIKIRDWIDVSTTLATLSGFLFWAPLIATAIGWHTLAHYLFVAFFWSLGAALITGVLGFAHDRDHFSKSQRFLQWVVLLAGIALLSVGFGILEFEPFAVLLFSPFLVRTLARRSLTDILNDQALAKHPWMDHLSDLFFLLGTLCLLLALFTDLIQIMIGLMLLCLSASLILDQIHHGINKRDEAGMIGAVLLSLMIFCVPGVLFLYFGLIG